jgi:hypothetical protein
MIILEGADCSGKTTLAKVIFNDFNYKHHGLYDKDPLIQTILEVGVGITDTIWDRLHLGEQVYGPIYRGKDTLGWDGLRMVERYLLSKQGVAIVALPPWQVVRDVFEERLLDEMFRHDDWEANLRSQYDAFEEIKTHLLLIFWDYVHDDPRALRDEYFNARPPWNAGPGVGDFSEGGVLIIGEQPNPTPLGAFAKMGLPFIARTGCSPWLAAEMNAVGIPERGLYWINALDRAGKTTSMDCGWLDKLKPKHIIPLGGIARAWAQMNGLDATSWFQHPAHWKRFHFHEDYPFISHLKELCDAT